ncbi:MAG: YncE family protein [Alphaproteobacteria bacterium]|nr:YncE family protein [Alphaproteobacteria bacterium]
MKTNWITPIALLVLCAGAAQAEIAVSANDGKQLRPGDTVTGTTPDSVSVLEFGAGRAKVIGQLTMPAAMIGPPTSVAISRDGKFALVSSCQVMVGDKLVPADILSVIDLSQPSHPRVIQTLHAGMGASGVSIRPDGKLALVANTRGDTISAFSISGKTLAPLGDVKLQAGTNPTDVTFSPDGKTAIVVAQQISSLLLLSVNGTQVALTGKAITPGRTPYGALVTHDGKYVINTNLGGGTPLPGVTPEPGMSSEGTISMSAIASGVVMASMVVGHTPEHVTLSLDGKYVAVVVANHTAAVRSDPKFISVLGLLEIYAVGDGTLTLVARADTGHWCQGAVFSKDGGTVLLQCAAEREIEVFHFNGKSLQRSAAAIAMVSRPGAIATASSR